MIDANICINVAINGFVVSCDDGEVRVAKTQAELLDIISGYTEDPHDE